MGDFLTYTLLGPVLFLVALAVAVFLILRASSRIPGAKRRLASKPTTGTLTDNQAQIDRINLLSQNARTTWFALLSYLAFVGVATLGVQDADFFIPARETDLPVVGISIPTARFFAVAPTIGVILYAYMHLHLLKLWDAIAEAPVRIDGRPLSEFLSPWLINDLALNRKHPMATQRRPMPALAFWATFLLSFFGGPVVLGYMWLKTLPAHNEMLTVLACGLPLVVSLYAGMKSWVHLCKRAGRPSIHERWKTAHWLVLALAFSVLGWLRTEAGFDHYARQYFAEPVPDWVEDHWLLSWSRPKWLASANLKEVAFVELPESWRDLSAWKDQYRVDWCRNYGLPAAACGAVGEGGTEPGSRLYQARQDWCRATLGPSNDLQCQALLLDAEGAFDGAWRAERRSMIAALPKVDLSGKDLRGADLTAAVLTGVRLQRARLQEAVLIQAHLQGANLQEAQLQKATLRQAMLQGARLRGANLQGANLRLAELPGANLRQVRMDARTDLASTTFARGSIWCADLSDARFSQAQLDSLFGDGTVVIPDGLQRPAHWPEQQLVPRQFNPRWREWQRGLNGSPAAPAESDSCPMEFDRSDD